jgi:signal transduction histidine kinase
MSAVEWAAEVAQFAGRAGGPNDAAEQDVPGEQLRTVCHDLRQPLATIALLTESAVAETEDPAATQARLSQIAAATAWMSSIVREVEAADTAATDLEIDLRDTARDSAAAPGWTEIVWRIELGESPIRMRANPVLLRRAVANMVDNACRAAGPVGTVRIRVRKVGRWAMIEVEDSGPGFGRIAKNHGLGMLVVTRAAAEYGGAVTVGESRRLGGARVQLRLCTEG